MSDRNRVPPMQPGGTLSVLVNVYDAPTIDGKIGGTPHVHLVGTESYFVLGGTGSVEIIDGRGFSVFELRRHTTLVFAPGTIHRLINPNRDLELLVTMQSGLPEHGDIVVCLPPAWMDTDGRFAEAMLVRSEEDAYRRRARGVEGFLRLKEAFTRSREEGLAALEGFYRIAAQRTRYLHKEWAGFVRRGALAEAASALDRIANLSHGGVGYLADASQAIAHAAPYDALGCCGRLSRPIEEGFAKQLETQE
jgi:mannose-6-phosphate isomerase-like protein (cupin superfamily)